MNYKVIACKMFEHEIEAASRLSPHRLDIEYFELGEHVRPATLRSKLQERIDAAIDYDAVLLCYGLCGRATDGLTARRIPIILPRSHDCGGILLGSRKRYEAIFKEMPSTPFSSIGIVEHGDYYFTDGDLMLGDSYAALVETYGEDNAKYIHDMMHPRLEGKLQPVYFISMPEIPADDARAQCRQKAEAEERPFKELAGDLRLLAMLLGGNHPAEEFLTVQPGEHIHQTGDWDTIIQARPR